MTSAINRLREERREEAGVLLANVLKNQPRRAARARIVRLLRERVDQLAKTASGTITGTITAPAPHPDQHVRIAMVLASTSRDSDVRLLGKHWEKVVGMDSVKEELLRQARALTAANVLPAGPGRRTRCATTGEELPNELGTGDWVKNSNGSWWGQIVDIKDSEHSCTIHWYHVNDWEKSGYDTISASCSFRELRSHLKLPGDPRPTPRWKRKDQP